MMKILDLCREMGSQMKKCLMVVICILSHLLLSFLVFTTSVSNYHFVGGRNPMNPWDPINQWNPMNPWDSTNQWDSTNRRNSINSINHLWSATTSTFNTEAGPSNGVSLRATPFYLSFIVVTIHVVLLMH
jgi:hypothetical protein